jgi:hypothetical protein
MKPDTHCTWMPPGGLLATAGASGCVREVSHTECNKFDWMGGGQTPTEPTFYQNPEGTIRTQSRVQTAK